MSDHIAFDMVVIGGTGDLARRKLLPALYILHRHGALAPEGRIMGMARNDIDSTTYRELVRQQAQRHIPEDDFIEDVFESFVERISYFPTADATQAEALGDLAKALDSVPEDRARIFYLATSPSLYGGISRALRDAQLVTESTRIVLEKPIGHDLESARGINALVGEVFEEHQIYRIDHYLGKETVQNLMVLRFGNALFEPMWSREHIDHVQITVAESLGVEGRGAYYDQSGALRDMVQNHLLQLLCLVAMEPPSKLHQDAIRDEKIKVLRSLRPIEGSELGKNTVRGQYRAGAIQGASVPGYLEEEGIPEASTTETFVALRADIDNWRWAGVPFYLRTGKRMSARVSEIIIQFKDVPHQLFNDQKGTVEENRLVIRLQPDEKIRLAMMVKVPGSGMDLKRVHLHLNLKDTFEGSHTPLAYERLLLDVIRGNATLFMHRQEVEEAWKWIEPILDGWAERDQQPRQYGAGTWGPPESIALVVRDDRDWYEHLV